MERGEQCLDHPDLGPVPDARADRLEEADRHVVTEAGCNGDEGVVADGAGFAQDPRQVARVHADRRTERPQAQPFRLEDPPQLRGEGPAQRPLPFVDQVLDLRLAHGSVLG